MKILIVLTLTVIPVAALTAKAQYPFEKYPAVKYKEYTNWQIFDKLKEEKQYHYTLRVADFYNNHDAVTIQLTAFEGSYDGHLALYRNKAHIQKFNGFGGFSYEAMGPKPSSVFKEDINGDSLNDLKILIPGNGCCGAYNYYIGVIYLFQKPDGTFTIVSFSDLMMEYINRPERDIDGDGNFEIITQTFRHVGNHNYWLFNLYSFTEGKLLNVNHKDNYPIMVQLLNRDNYDITKRITRERMKLFEKKLPDGYDKKNSSSRTTLSTCKLFVKKIYSLELKPDLS